LECTRERVCLGGVFTSPKIIHDKRRESDIQNISNIEASPNYSMGHKMNTSQQKVGLVDP